MKKINLPESLYNELSIEHLKKIDPSAFDIREDEFETVSKDILGNHIRSSNYLSYILSILFEPFIKQNTISDKNVYFRSKESFINRGFDNSILDIFYDFKKDFIKILKEEVLYNEQDLILAGGKLTDYLSGFNCTESIGDYDIWLLSDTILNLHCVLKSRKDLFKDISHNGKYYSFEYKGKKFQLIYNTSSESAEDVLDLFDFRCCAIALDGDTFYWQKGALKDIKNKKIVVNKIDISRVYSDRLLKYFKKGFSISAVDFAMISLSSILGIGEDPNIDNDFLNNLFSNRSYIHDSSLGY